MVVLTNHAKENAVKDFIQKHRDQISGVIMCFDRLIFKGYLSLGWDGQMEKFLQHKRVLIKDFGRFAKRQSHRLKLHAQETARRHGRPYIYLAKSTRKDDLARKIAQRDNVEKGLICVFANVESSSTFRVVGGQGRPRLQRAVRRALCLYYYYQDPQFGFMHVRLQAWLPFAMQIYLNGHEILAKKLRKHGIGYRQEDNAFLWIEDCPRAQRLADRIVRRRWHRVFSSFAGRVNPLMNDLLRWKEYYWVADQCEFATDVMFHSPAALYSLYEKLLEHATRHFGAEDVMTFLGRKLHASFAGDIVGHTKRRWPGARIKHRMKENWIKMYDKHGSVLRIETVINQPREFKVRRQGIRGGQEVLGWFPMAKGVANLRHYLEVSKASNARYLQALSVVEDPREAVKELRRFAQPARCKGRSYRGFNPALLEDAELFAAVMRGEHTIHGFRNADVRQRLFKSARNKAEQRRQSTRVSRCFKRLHVHGLIAKIPRSRRWRVSKKGWAILPALLLLHRYEYPAAFAQAA
jgi:hypothetical protein